MTQTQPPYGQPPQGQPPSGQPPYGQSPSGQPPYVQAPPPPLPAGGTSTTAVLALVFAFVFAPAAIVLGFVARGQIRRTGQGGKGLATTGLVLGILFTLSGIASLIFLLVLAPRTLDTSNIKTKMISSTQEAAGVAPTDVSCPDNVVAKAGATFTCTATLDGQPLHYTVTQKDDQGNVDFSSETFVPLQKVETLVQQQVLQQSNTAVTAKCDAGGKTVLVSVPDTKIDCTVTNNADATDSVRYTATITDTQGNLSLEPAK